MKYIFFWVSIPLFGLFCSPSTPPNKQYLECYVRYLAPEGQLSVEATFREKTPGQTTLRQIEMPPDVKYNGETMQPVKIQGISCRLVRPGDYLAKHEFTWAGPQNRQLTFGTEMAPVTTFGFESAGITRDTPATLRWEGGPLDRGEILVLLWERAEGNLTVPMEITGTPGMRSVVFPAVKLKELEPGDWTLYLVRKKAVRTDVGGVEASALFEYYSRVIPVTVR